jgi:hypothetical protein
MRKKDTNKRDRKRHRKRHGMRMHNKGLKRIMAEQEAEHAVTPIIPGVTRFKCGTHKNRADTMVVIKKAKRGATKWIAAIDNDNVAYVPTQFDESYIRKYQIADKPSE